VLILTREVGTTNNEEGRSEDASVGPHILDLPLALAIVGLAMLIVLAPSSAAAFTPPM
jgi:hypothetical protein